MTAVTVRASKPTDTVPGVAIRVSPHHCGPPGMVNGGWAAGLTAGLLTGPDTAAGTPVEVTLRAPVPLETPVTGRRDGERALLADTSGALLTEAVVVAAVSPPPAFVPLAVAERAGAPGSAVVTPFPGCYVCGFEREGGLRVTIGRTGDGDGFAGVWIPPAATGELPARYVWAALDCPTGLVHLESGGRALLGRLTLAQHRSPVPGEPHVIVAWPTGAERRKRFSVAALYTSAGDLVAHSRAVWITI
jgi:hypothetical protein